MSTNAAARPRGRRLTISAAALACAVLAGGAVDLSAQSGHPHDDNDQPVSGHTGAGHRVVSGGVVYPGLATMIDRSGAAGALLRLHAQQLPPDRDVQVMVGALRDGFEVVQTLRTDSEGRIHGQDTVKVTVPEWVKNDRPYLVMITDLEYNPLAAADMFHPVAADGGLVRKGTIRREDPACPTLTGEGEELYFLVGDTGALVAGEETVVRGRLVEPGRCGNATTIEVATATTPQR